MGQLRRTGCAANGNRPFITTVKHTGTDTALPAVHGTPHLCPCCVPLVWGGLPIIGAAQQRDQSRCTVNGPHSVIDPFVLRDIDLYKTLKRPSGENLRSVSHRDRHGTNRSHPDRRSARRKPLSTLIFLSYENVLLC